jgi:hypothetical protein
VSVSEENKAAREAESRSVARDAAEAYKAAVSNVLERLEDNTDRMRDNDESVQLPREWRERRSALRDEARELVKQGRQLGIDVTRMAAALHVSRQTVHEWINEGQS